MSSACSSVYTAARHNHIRRICRAVARVPVLPVFDPKESKRKIFAAFLLFTPKSLKCTFFVLTTKVIKSGVVRKQKRSRGVRYTQDKSRKDLRLLSLGRKRVPGPQPYVYDYRMVYYHSLHRKVITIKMYFFFDIMYISLCLK